MRGVVKIGLFKRKKKQEIRADTSAGDSTSILTFFGITGVLTREAALSIPTVSACINKIGETVSRLPVKLYRKDADEVTEIFDDPRLKLLNGDTGDTLSTVDMWKAAVEDYYLGSGAWIYIHTSGGITKSLHYVDSTKVSILNNADPVFKAFRVQINAQNYYDFQFIKLLRKTKDGYTNIPLQEEASDILSAAWNALKLENTMNSNGGCKPGFLKSKNRLSDAAISAIKEGYSKVYDNKENRDKIIVLNDGIDFEAIASTAAELQMNENKKTNSIEICKLFGFPHTVIDGGASDDDNKKFIGAVIAFLNQVETELDNVLLLEVEKKQGYYWAFDTKELTRGSLKERYDAYEIAVRNNILQIDEIRREEDYEPLGFNFIKLGLQDVLLNPQTMDVFTPNTGQTKNLLTGEVRADSLELRHNPNHDDKGRFSSGGGGGSSAPKPAETVDKSEESGIIKEEDMINSPIKQTHTGKGNANAILMFDVELNNRQQELLNKLPEYGSKTTVPKDSVNMADLSALTAKTGVEYAMFTKGGERLVLRGGVADVPIYKSDALRLASEGYRWSGHTHPGTNFICLSASAGDLGILNCFPQQTSVIYNSKGEYLTFSKMLGKE